MKTLNDLHFADLLPDSIKDDATTKALAEVLDIEFCLLLAEMNVPQFLLRVDDMEEPELSILARELCAPFWEPALSVERKREVIKKSLIWNMTRGTSWCVRDALATVYGNATLEEWHGYNGTRGTFKVRVESDDSVTKDSFGRLTRILAETKRQSQHLEALVIPRSGGSSLVTGGMCEVSRPVIGAMQHHASGNGQCGSIGVAFFLPLVTCNSQL